MGQNNLKHAQAMIGHQIDATTLEKSSVLSRGQNSKWSITNHKEGK